MERTTESSRDRPAPRGGDDVPLSSAAPSRPPRGEKQVCPFCGTLAETSDRACPVCTLEDTDVTRRATRAKLGPWYVLQSRNPAAPGMNFATLVALIDKGRITPRSILRGPTTGQFWRLASQVKGVSREFGLCWHCAGQISRATRLCRVCSRLQDPPLNPDVLLEPADLPDGTALPPVEERLSDVTAMPLVTDATSPVLAEAPAVSSTRRREVGMTDAPSPELAEAPRTSVMSMPPSATQPARAGSVGGTFAAPAGDRSNLRPSPPPTTTGKSNAGNDPLALSLAEPSSPRPRAKNAPPTADPLPPPASPPLTGLIDAGARVVAASNAREFSAGDVDDSEGLRLPGEDQPRGRVGRGLLIATVVSAGVLAAILYRNPELGRHYLEKFKHGTATLGAKLENDVALRGAPATAPFVGRPGTTQGISVAPGLSDDQRLAGSREYGASATRAVSSDPLPDPPPARKTEARTGETKTFEGPAAVVSAEGNPAGNQRRAWELWREGTNAEVAKDYAGAIKAYEAIKGLRLPEERVPVGVDQSLERCRRELEARGGKGK